LHVYASETVNSMKDVSTVIFEFLEGLLGEGGVEVASTIYDNEYTDEEIAKETNIRVNTVRKVLYRLYDNRLASYRRTRDKKTGWYIYYWKMDLNKASEVMRSLEKEYLQQLMERLEHERNNMFFSCDNGCDKVIFDVASENDFRCPGCNGRLSYVDNSSLVRSLEEQIKKLETGMEN
jgi:transcription initiation factor TFIIE subunit alpha